MKKAPQSPTGAKPPTFQADMKKQGTRLKGWSVRKCVVADKTLTYSHRFGGSQSIQLTQDTFIHLDGCDVHITGPGNPQPAVFRASSRRLAMQLKAALLQEIGWRKKSKEKANGAPTVSPESAAASRDGDRFAIEHTRSLKLCQASADGAADVIQRLVTSENDVNSTITGSAPLHWACFEGKPDVVKKLLKMRASPHLEDRTGMTPAETCVYLGTQNQLQILNLFARQDLRQTRCNKLFGHLISTVRQRNEGVTPMTFNRIFIDFCIGRRNYEALRDGGNVLQYPRIIRFPHSEDRERLNAAIAGFLRATKLQKKEADTAEPAATIIVPTSGLDLSHFTQYTCDFPPGTLGMYFKGKNHDDDVVIDNVAEDSLARKMGCQQGDLLISVCGTDCRARGLQHAVDCVLQTQTLPERRFVFGRLKGDRSS